MLEEGINESPLNNSPALLHTLNYINKLGPWTEWLLLQVFGEIKKVKKYLPSHFRQSIIDWQALR